MTKKKEASSKEQTINSDTHQPKVEFEIEKPIDIETFCKEKQIIGLIFDFLNKKYPKQSFLLSEWNTILEKENIIL